MIFWNRILFESLLFILIIAYDDDRKQAEKDYDVVTGTRYAQGGGVSTAIQISAVNAVWYVYIIQ